ncbi:MAG: hypothetical protein ACJ70U_09930 [Nitrososphaera sp.]
MEYRKANVNVIRRMTFGKRVHGNAKCVLIYPPFMFDAGSIYYMLALLNRLDFRCPNLEFVLMVLFTQQLNGLKEII